LVRKIFQGHIPNTCYGKGSREGNAAVQHLIDKLNISHILPGDIFAQTVTPGKGGVGGIGKQGGVGGQAGTCNTLSCIAKNGLSINGANGQNLNGFLWH
jgi:hypothetical protein